MRDFSYGTVAADAATGITITGVSTLNYLWPAASPSVNIAFTRHAVSQAANATSAQQRIQFGYKVHATGASFVSATPAHLQPADPNASVIAGATTPAAGKCGVGVSTATEETGAVTIVWDDGFNVLNGYLIVTPPPQAFIAPAGWASMAVLRFPTAPATLSGWNWFQYFSEV